MSAKISPKALKWAAGLFVLLAILWFLPGFLPSREREVREAIEAIAGHFEQEHLTEVRLDISPDYRGEIFGNKEELMPEIDRAFRQMERLDIDIEAIEVHLKGEDAAEVMIVYEVSGSVTGGIYNRVPFRGVRGGRPGLGVGDTTEAVYAELEQSPSGRWQIKYVDWEVERYLADFPDSAARIEP